MTTNKPHPFATQLWLTVPFENRVKNPSDELVDILLSLPGCLKLAGKISNQRSRDFHCIERTLHENVLNIMSQLDHWYEQYCFEAVEPDGRRRTFLGPSAEKIPEMSGQQFDTPQRRIYRDMHTAVFSAIYDAASLITYSLLVLVSPPTEQY